MHIYTLIISFTKFECMTDYKRATAINGNTVYLHMHRDNFSDPATVEEVFTVQDISPVADKKEKLPAPKAAKYEAFLSLLDCPLSPKPSG